MNLPEAKRDIERLRRELRRLKFRVGPELRPIIAALERVCGVLEKQLKSIEGAK